MATPTEILESVQAAVAELKTQADVSAANMQTFSETVFKEFLDISDADPPEFTFPGYVDRLDFGTELDAPSWRYPLNETYLDQFKSPTYVSSFFKFLEPKLIEFITEESTGISEEVQDALFENMREHDLQVLNDSLDALNREQASRGFPLVSSMLLAARNDLIKKYTDIRFNRNREITALIAERAQQNVMHAIDAGNTMEQIQSQFSLGFARLWVDFSNMYVSRFRAEMDAAIAEFEADLKVQVTDSELSKFNKEILMRHENNELESWKADVAENINRLQLQAQDTIKRYDLALQSASEVLRYYEAAVAGYAGQINAVTVATESSA
jgi:hypothetical protein